MFLSLSLSVALPLPPALSLRPHILSSFQRPGSTLTYAYVNGSASEPVEVIVCIFNWPIDWQIGIDCLVYLSLFLSHSPSHKHTVFFFSSVPPPPDAQES